MPLYEYECTKCHHRTEVLQKLNDPAPPCPECEGETRKLVSAPAFKFKGSGWYVTDYADKNKKGAGSSSSSSGDSGGTSDSSSSSDSKSDSGSSSSDSKSDAKPTKGESNTSKSQQ